MNNTAKRFRASAILTDIEGTTSSISFVKDVLFPYAYKEIAEYVRCNRDNTAVQGILEDVRRYEDRPDMTEDEIVILMKKWIEEDRKITPLKALQGMIWEEGYKQGAFKGHIYDDALQNLQAWHSAGIALFIYSSGSVPAQKLLFSHTDAGDLTPMFSGYFDTGIGGKLEVESYGKIAAAIGEKVANILFLSDNVKEIEAAAKAGMQVCVLDRDGAGGSAGFAICENFDEIIVEKVML